MTKEMTAPSQSLADVQSQADQRKIAIDEVGVSGVRMPVLYLDLQGNECAGVAEYTLTVRLPQEQKGTHMSRFIEMINQDQDLLSIEALVIFVEKMKQRLNATEAQLRVSFEAFVAKAAPVTGKRGLQGYPVNVEIISAEKTTVKMGVTVRGTSLCPCSKEISDYGAHSQRCVMNAEVEYEGDLHFEELIKLIEQAASAPLHPILKREDEKFVTEQAYDNPRFVEDVVREMARILDSENRIKAYTVSSENQESIHTHNAWAKLSRVK